MDHLGTLHGPSAAELDEQAFDEHCLFVQLGRTSHRILIWSIRTRTRDARLIITRAAGYGHNLNMWKSARCPCARALPHMFVLAFQRGRAPARRPSNQPSHTHAPTHICIYIYIYTYKYVGEYTDTSTYTCDIHAYTYMPCAPVRQAPTVQRCEVQLLTAPRATGKSKQELLASA